MNFIAGFNITFYMVSLPHSGIYTMVNIGQLKFPRSLEEIDTFATVPNLLLLLWITESFWRDCCLVENPEELAKKKRPTYKELYSAIDMSQDSSLTCAIRFIH
jgi:hypothetical protein